MSKKKNKEKEKSHKELLKEAQDIHYKEMNERAELVGKKLQELLKQYQCQLSIRMTVTMPGITMSIKESENAVAHIGIIALPKE